MQQATAMDAKASLQVALNSAVMLLLRPLCRLLLRHHVPFAAFEELAKHVYVQSAMEDFGIPGKRPTLSRASILTGLTRKDVQRLVAQPAPARAASDEGYSRAARVLTGWARDGDFHAPGGAPKALALQEGSHSFAALVRRYSGDMPARAMLDELLRVGAVRERDDGRIELATPAYIPKTGEVEKLGILGSDAADLIATIDHNLAAEQKNPRFQRKVMYRNYPSAPLSAFRRHSAAEAQALLEKFDRWLVEHASDDTAETKDAPRTRVGVGIYYFEEPMAPQENHGDLT